MGRAPELLLRHQRECPVLGRAYLATFASPCLLLRPSPAVRRWTSFFCRFVPIVRSTWPSSAIPVTAFSEHLNLGSGFSDSGDQDSILETYLRAALAAIEARLGIALFRRRFSWGLYAWSNPNTQRLPVSPVQRKRRDRF